MKSIKRIEGGAKETYCYKYLEEIDEEKNIVLINAEMKIDLNSKAAKNKLNKAWSKDKSPLLIELQRIFREHEIDKKEKDFSKWYNPIE